MKNLKTLSIIGIIISGLGLLGGSEMLISNNSLGVLTMVLYGYYLAFSIVALRIANQK